MRSARGIFAGSAALATGAAYAAVDGERFSRAYERLRADRSYQFEFTEQPAPPEPPGWLEAVADVIASVLRIAAPFIEIIFWAGVVLIAAGAAFLIGREIYRFAQKDRSKTAGAEAEKEYRPAPELARALLEEADRLAAEGRYGDAVHVLLFRSIEDIQLHRPNRVKIAMTSREIARIPILSASAARAFARIAAAVEACHFAGKRIGSEVFAECREAYLGFAAAEEWA